MVLKITLLLSKFCSYWDQRFESQTFPFLSPITFYYSYRPFGQLYRLKTICQSLKKLGNSTCAFEFPKGVGPSVLGRLGSWNTGWLQKIGPLKSDFKQSLDLYFQIYQGQLLSLTFVNMIISNDYFKWWPTFLARALKWLGADEQIL